MAKNLSGIDRILADPVSWCPMDLTLKAQHDQRIAAVCPRAISVVELDDKFVISYLEAPVEAPNQVMAGWIESLRNG